MPRIRYGRNRGLQDQGQHHPHAVARLSDGDVHAVDAEHVVGPLHVPAQRLHDDLRGGGGRGGPGPGLGTNGTAAQITARNATPYSSTPSG